MGLGAVVQFLETYRGRDKIIRTVSYCALCATGMVKTEKNAKKLTIVSKQLGDCRVVLRLFDDLPMLAYSLGYGLGKQESDTILRVLGIANNVVDHIFYPLEHIAWCADNRLVPLFSMPWAIGATMCWALSLYLNIIRGLRRLAVLQIQKMNLRNLESDVRSVKEQIQTKQFRELLCVICSLADLANAIHWLPFGFLWSGRLKHWQVGAFGTISSLIGLYLAVSTKK